MMKFSPRAWMVLLFCQSSSLMFFSRESAVVQGAGHPVCHAEDRSCVAAHASADCHVYMAPSTIGVANLGIYTAVALEPGSVVNHPDIAIPLLFRDWASHPRDDPDGILWDRYIWDHGVANIEPKTSDLEREDEGAVFVPGVGCTINSRMHLHNIWSTHGGIYDTAGLHRSRDVGSGAFTPYHSSQTTAYLPMAPGTELFAAYGESWIPDLPDAIITLDDNMDNADDFLEEYAEWVQGTLLHEDVKEGLWDLTKEFPYPSIILGVLPQQPWSVVAEELEKKLKMTSTTTNPTTPSSEDSPGNTDTSTVRHFLHQTGRRDVEWLKEHGKCQDHLKSGRSTLDQAGRGAFAARDLPEGTVVGYSPLVHMGNARDMLTIEYPATKEHPKYALEDLIINYSFGHPNSTVLLTPYGAMVNYINHHRERANVKVVWPSKELVAHKPDWLERDVEFLSNVHEKIGLSYDYVALRDIQEGEEIFMDYGDDWIQAWEDHVSKWKPNSEDYVHSTEWTEPTLRTLEELTANPYPSNLQTLCHESYRSSGGAQGYVFMPVVRNKSSRRYCDVLERHVDADGAVLYTVKLYLNKDQSVVIHQVPSPGGVELMDKLKSADWHLPNAFRHPIQIPNLPEAWKNKQ